MEHDSESHNDPASWNKSSYEAHPVDSMEPLTGKYRRLQGSVSEISSCLSACDTHMCSSGDARLAWVQISIACGLHSTRGRTETAVAEEIGITKQAFVPRGSEISPYVRARSGIRS
jgi:hypothetical protein